MPRCSLGVAALLLVFAAARISAAEPDLPPADEPRDRAADEDPGEDSTASDQPAEFSEPAPRNPRVLFIVSGDCGRCREELQRLRKPGGEFEAMQARGWKIGESPDSHLQIVDRETIPEFVRELKVREFPTVCAISDGQIIRSFKEGCTTPLDAWTFGFLLKGSNERPRGAILEAARVKWTGSYPLRGNHWSVEGDWNPTQERLIGHLRGPNHGHQITASWAIDAWSYEELRSLHDDLHERELASGGTTVASGASGSFYYPRSSSMSSSTNFHSAGHKMGR
jgi:hypothetical protein